MNIQAVTVTPEDLLLAVLKLLAAEGGRADWKAHPVERIAAERMR